MKKVSLVVPMYNEEEMIPLFFSTLNNVIAQIKNYKFEYVIVNDGSKDNTLKILKEYRNNQANINIVSFSRNFGHEAAVNAGLDYSKGDIIIVMDADLQDPPDIIEKMLAKYEQGYLVVNGKRVDRHKDPLLKRKTAEWFYRVIAKLSGKIHVPDNVGNYRLLDRKVVDEIIQLKERNRVFRVEVPFVGYKTTQVEFIRQERPKGKTHYNYKSMFALAGDSITSSSTIPLKWAFSYGIGISIISFLCFLTNLVLIILSSFQIYTPSHYSSSLFLIISSIFLGVGIILIFLGIIGIYVGRILNETQERPTYIVDEVLD